MNYLISGAASPLGRVLCKKLTDIGCAVTAVVRDSTAFSKEKKLSKNIDVVECDLNDPNAVEELCNNIEQAEKKIWSFIHLAATSPSDSFDMLQMSNSFTVNVFSGWRIANTCIDLMEKDNGGRIVFVGSVGHRFGGKVDRPAYSGSKFLLEYFPRRFRECASNNVLVNTLRLGVMEGGTQEKTGVEEHQMAPRVALIPTRRAISHEEASENIMALSGRSNRSTHNSVISCTGGE